MIPEYPEMLSFKLSTMEKQKIDELVSKGKFPNRGKLIRSALNDFFQKENAQKDLNGLKNEPGLT